MLAIVPVTVPMCHSDVLVACFIVEDFPSGDIQVIQEQNNPDHYTTTTMFYYDSFFVLLLCQT